MAGQSFPTIPRRVLCELIANVGLPFFVLSASLLPYPPNVGIGTGLELRLSFVFLDNLER